MNILVEGNVMGNRASNNHVLGRNGYTLWKIRLTAENYTIDDCIESNITTDELENGKVRRKNYLTETDLMQIMLNR